VLKSIQNTLILLLLITSTQSKSQEIPPIQNYTPEVYDAENQNWSLSQASNKYIYVANNRGLLEFDGAKWKLFTSPNNSIIRSVTVVGENIYTGCYMEFGFWKRNNFGQLEYNSISKNLKEELLEDESFWKIIPLDKWILFQSLNRIYIYDTIEKTFKVINSKTVLQKIFKIENTIYFQKTNDGLYKIENGNSILVSDDPILKKNLLVNIYSQDETLCLLTQEKGFYKVHKNKLQKWTTESEALLSKISVYSSIRTENGDFILGTISNGIYHLDKNGKTLLNVDQEKGLNNNTVLDIFEDVDQNIWLGLDNGISVLNFNSTFKVYNDINGKLGTTYTSIKHNDNLYIGTNQGLFFKKTSSTKEFEFIKGTEGQVWSLKTIDKVLFCGHNSGTFIIEDKVANLMSIIPGTWKTEQFPDSENTILQGNYNGLSILKKTKNKWAFSNTISGFDNSSRYFEIISNTEIAVTHEYKGVYQVEIDKAHSKAINITIDKTLKGKKSSLTKYLNEYIYYFEKGVYNYEPKLHKFVKNEFLDNGITTNEKYVSGKLINTNDDRLWGFTDKNIIYFSPGILNNTPSVTKIFLPVDLRKDYTGYENITHLKNETYLLGTSFGYLILDTEKLDTKSYKVELNQITKRILNESEEIVSLSDNNNYKYLENNLEFSFSVPTYEKFTEVSYRYILEGRHKLWSKWSQDPEVFFKNLPFGNYTFRVKAKVGNTETENEITYNFVIERPWYISNEMITLYLIAFLFVFILIHNIYKQYYKRQKKSLLTEKQREFERSQLENEREIMKLRNDKLRNDIESKNRELAVSTMSIIKKNEFLNTIKNELSEVKDSELIKPVIKIIDKNLNNTSDWKLFQEAFNNADKDFLIKVKDRHPGLTPNDLRLCAYLRLNLSSKEIAPLLNISHKSVEIKRYRLRKKMELTKKENLIHHILEI
jgi:DNA-binding CsgD family transcriptional regulator/cell division protein FtsB